MCLKPIYMYFIKVYFYNNSMFKKGHSSYMGGVPAYFIGKLISLKTPFIGIVVNL